MWSIDQIVQVRDIIVSRPELQRLAPTLISLANSHIEANYEISDLRTRLFHEQSGGSGDIERW